MSNNSQKYDQPGCGHVFFSFVGILVLLGLFALIVYITYVPTRTDDDAAVGQARKAYRIELEAKQKEEAVSYGWVNQPEGKVRIPIERAMELTVRELSAKQEGNASK